MAGRNPHVKSKRTGPFDSSMASINTCAKEYGMKSLYVHFPFCETKCHYCDFYSLGRERTQPTDAGKFEKALRSEIVNSASMLDPQLETLFFGGGTPSMTAYDSMARALEPLWNQTSVSATTEWTMEANPSSISLQSFQAFRSYGVNRISMGVQALRPDLLQLLGRVHSREDALKALGIVFEAGFENVSVDLLCGAPGQSESDLDEALTELTRFPISHLSCYLLTLPPHHRMASQLPNEDIQLSHLLFIHNWLSANGFEHYEISNFAKAGKKSRHNLNYWKGQSYLGLGPSAHSFNSLTLQRWKNVSSLHKYANLLESGQSVIEWTETLTTEQVNLERWMLALRLNDGFPDSWLMTPTQKQRVKLFEIKGLLEHHPTLSSHWRLTPKGFALSDQVIQSLA